MKAAAHYGQLRAELERAGTPCGPHDMPIGGHARSEGLTVVTNNVREFIRMPGLRTQNWLQTPDAASRLVRFKRGQFLVDFFGRIVDRQDARKAQTGDEILDGQPGELVGLSDASVSLDSLITAIRVE